MFVLTSKQLRAWQAVSFNASQSLCPLVCGSLHKRRLGLVWTPQEKTIIQGVNWPYRQTWPTHQYRAFSSATLIYPSWFCANNTACWQQYWAMGDDFKEIDTAWVIALFKLYCMSAVKKVWFRLLVLLYQLIVMCPILTRFSTERDVGNLREILGEMKPNWNWFWMAEKLENEVMLFRTVCT